MPGAARSRGLVCLQDMHLLETRPPFILPCLVALRTGRPVTSAMLTLNTARLALHSCTLRIFWPGA
jgi:hypothetical protein